MAVPGSNCATRAWGVSGGLSPSVLKLTESWAHSHWPPPLAGAAQLENILCPS